MVTQVFYDVHFLRDKQLHILPYAFFLKKIVSLFIKVLAIVVAKKRNVPVYSITCLERPLKRDQSIGFQDLYSLRGCQKVLFTYIKIPNGFQSFVLSIFEWSLKTGFTVH